MERSIITDQVHPDLETALREIQKMGYRSVELHNVFGKSIEACTDEEVSQIKLFLDRYGMRVSNIASTICFCVLYMREMKFRSSIRRFSRSRAIWIRISGWLEGQRRSRNN